MKKLIALLLAALLIIGMTACSTKQTPAEETKTEPTQPNLRRPQRNLHSSPQKKRPSRSPGAFTKRTT